MSHLREALLSGKFVITVETSPPKGVRLHTFMKIMEGLTGKIDAVNLPDGRSARIHLNPLSASLLAMEKGLEPILTLSCRDRNRLSLCSDLLGAFVLGLRNVLCVSGDYFTFGDTVDARPVYDLDSVQAIQMIRQMEDGKDAGGNLLDGTPEFCAGCVANPQASPLEPHLIKLEKKLEAGAEFIQTLDLYDLDQAFPFLDALKGREVKVLAGLRLVTDTAIGLWEEGRLPGNPIPDVLREEIIRIKDAGQRLETAKRRLVEMIKRVKESGLCDGVHLTADGHEDLIPEILEEAEI